MRKQVKHMNHLRHYGSSQEWQRLMIAARNSSDVRQLKPIHAIFITSGHSLTLAHHFAGPGPEPAPNCFACNALLSGYSRNRHRSLALRCFKIMLAAPHGITDHWTFNFALLACVNSPPGHEGSQIHALTVKNGLASSDCHIPTALIRFYAVRKDIESARQVFDEITLVDNFHCDALMHGYVEHGSASEALRIFWDIPDPDEHCLTTAINACAHSGSLSAGVKIHHYIRKKVRAGRFTNTALVDMYAKCGRLDKAVEVFEKIRGRNAHTWTAMISAFGSHGHPARAFHCLESMSLDDHTAPDGVSIFATLKAYANSGLVTESRSLLLDMESRYGVPPEHEHFGCVAALLSRVGRLREAYELIQEMPVKPRASIWGGLLSGCRAYNNVELAEIAFDELRVSESKDKVGDCVMLRDVYLGAGRIEDAERLSKMIIDRGHRVAEKKPLCVSMIEINGTANEFRSGVPMRCYSLHAQIVRVLDLISTCSIRCSEDIDLYSCYNLEKYSFTS